VLRAFIASNQALPRFFADIKIVDLKIFLRRNKSYRGEFKLTLLFLWNERTGKKL